MLDILDVWRDMTGRAPVTRNPPLAKRDILSRKALPRSQRICVLCCCSRRLRDGVAERCLQLLLAVRAVFCDGASAVLMHQRDEQWSPRPAPQRSRVVLLRWSSRTTVCCSCCQRPHSARREEKSWKKVKPCQLAGITSANRRAANTAAAGSAQQQASRNNSPVVLRALLPAIRLR